MTSAATSGGDLRPTAPSPEAGFLDTGYLPPTSDLYPETTDDAPNDNDVPNHGESGWEETGDFPLRRTLDAEFSESQVALVDADGLRAMGQRAQALSYLWVSLEAPGPQYRGRLGLYLEEAIEQQLEERGALPPGMQASTGLDASLSDQLYRARLLEMRGIALGIPSLEGITNLGRSLDADDSAVLRWWIAEAAQRPVQLVISNENIKLRVYPSPVLFETLFEVAHKPVTPRPPSLPMAESSESMDLSDLPPCVERTSVPGTEVTSAEPLYDRNAFAQDEPVGQEEDCATPIDVELPDLDRALGLSPAEHLTEAHMETRSLQSGDSEQLPLSYENLLPTLVHTQNEPSCNFLESQIVSPAPPPETEQWSSDDNPLRDAAQPGRQSKELDRVENCGPYLGDLDEDEFLRTLEEDSAKVPEVKAALDNIAEPDNVAAPDNAAAPDNVAAADEAALLGQAEPPKPEVLLGASEEVPTKRMFKNPFIRMANQRDAISESAEVTSARVKVSAGEPAFDQKVHETTLSGAAAPDPNDPFNQLAAREWKTWVINLEAARGPKPLSVIERMFVTEYTRLREAVRRGVAPSSAASILDEWQQSFERSYSEAFDALRVRGKRPTMVLDLPEMAARLGRLQGAKRVQLLLVDGLRFDLGLMVQDRMREQVDAALTERLLLWSALPSVTQYQLELLGRGPDGLKEPGESDEPPALVARGPAARVPRRVRTGHLELFKLDVVEDCLRESGKPIISRMDAIAQQTSLAICDYLNKQPARTMVVVFGDHGFRLDPKKAGTSEEASQGGSSPEEVLVPAFAWLTGAVH